MPRPSLRTVLAVIALAVGLFVCLVAIARAIELNIDAVDLIARIVIRVEAETGWSYEAALDVVLTLLVFVLVAGVVALAEVTRMASLLIRQILSHLRGKLPDNDLPYLPRNPPWRWLGAVAMMWMLSLASVKLL